MASNNTLTGQLKAELDELLPRYPGMRNNEDLFIVWFLRAYVTDDSDAAAKAITNGPKDKGVDAVFIDEPSRSVFVVQGKYRHDIGTKSEGRAEVMGFAQLAHVLTGNDKQQFQVLLEDADPTVAQKLSEARERLLRRGYRLWLYYVTLGKCSPNLRKEAEATVRTAPGTVILEIPDSRRLKVIMRDYLDGVAPPNPSLDLVMERGQGIRVNGILQRYDARSQIESWVFSMQGDAIAKLYEMGGKRLFARNIRGFLGESTAVNRSMQPPSRRNQSVSSITTTA